MSTDLVAIERHAAITVIRLNRPPANAIDIELGRHFQAAFESAMAKHPAALVLTGAGRFFSGGLDLKAVPTYSASEQREMLRTLNRFVATLYARNFGPEEARRRGVFDELQPAGGVLERALEVARDLASMPADGYRRIKQQFRRAAIEQLERVASSDADPLLEGWLRSDARQASAAILDDR